MHKEKSTISLFTAGYTFHLVVISLIGWNGTLLFLPGLDESEQILYWFNATQLVAFPMTFFVGSLASQRWKIELYAKALALFATVLSMLGVAILFVCCRSEDASGISLMASAAGVFTGIGNSLFFLSWQNIFAVQSKSEIAIELTLGTGAAGAIYLVVIQSKPDWLPFVVLVISFVANVALLLIAIGWTRESRERGYPSCANKEAWKQLFDKLWRPALCVASLAFARGVAPALVLDDPIYGSTLSTLMTFGRILSAVLFFVLWKKAFPSVSFWIDRLYSAAVVLVATGFVFLPLFGKEYQFIFAIVAYTIFSIASLFMMLLCATTARSLGIRPLTVYGCFGGFVYAFSRAGFGAAYFAHIQTEFGFVQLAMIALVSVYLFLLVYFVSRRKQPSVTKQGESSGLFGTHGAEKDLQGSVVGLRPDSDQGNFDANECSNFSGDLCRDEYAQNNLTSGFPEGPLPQMQIKDVFHSRCVKMADETGLSSREAEIMEYLALGRSVPYIAETLYISENTVRTHCKSIYRKLGIHSKRELMDIVEESNVQE